MDKIPGDIRVFMNFGVKVTEPNYRLENSIYLGGDLYYAHPLGIITAKKIIAELEGKSDKPKDVAESGVSRRPQIPK